MPTIGNIALSGRRGETARIRYQRKQYQLAREAADRRIEESRAAVLAGDREVEMLARERGKEHPPGFTPEGYRAKMRAQHGPSWFKRIWSNRAAEIRQQAVPGEQVQQEEANRLMAVQEAKRRGIVAKIKYLLMKKKQRP